MKTCLTLISPQELAGLNAAEVDQALKAFDAVSIKLLDGAHKLTSAPTLAFIKRLRALGVAVHGWGWVNARNAAEAVLEARTAAQVCNALEIDTWYVNCEKTWAGVEDAPRTPAPYAMLDLYLTTFYENAPGKHIVYNGFSWPQTSLKTGARKLHDAHLMRRVWGYCPM